MYDSYDSEELLKKFRHIGNCFGIVEGERYRGNGEYNYNIIAYCGQNKEIRYYHTDKVLPYVCPVCGVSTHTLSRGWNTVEVNTQFTEGEDIASLRYEYNLVCWTQTDVLYTSKFWAEIDFDIADRVFRIRYQRGKRAPVEQERHSVNGIVADSMSYRWNSFHLFPAPQNTGPRFPTISNKSVPAFFQQKLIEFYNKRQKYEEFLIPKEEQTKNHFDRILLGKVIVGFYNPVFVQFANEYHHVVTEFRLRTKLDESAFVRIVNGEVTSMNEMLDIAVGWPVPKALRKKFKNRVFFSFLFRSDWIERLVGHDFFKNLIASLNEEQATLIRNHASYARDVAGAIGRVTNDPKLTIKRTIAYVDEALAISKGETQVRHLYVGNPQYVLLDMATLLRDTFYMAGELEVKIRFQDINTLAKLRAVHDRLAALHRQTKYEYDRQRFQKRVEEMLPFEYENEEYRIVVPRSPEDIVQEGAIMGHCVGSYVPQVVNGRSYIFSTQTKDGDRVGTIEVNVKEKAVTQLYDRGNSRVSERVKMFVKQWAKKHKLIYRAL